MATKSTLLSCAFLKSRQLTASQRKRITRQRLLFCFLNTKIRVIYNGNYVYAVLFLWYKDKIRRPSSIFYHCCELYDSRLEENLASEAQTEPNLDTASGKVFLNYHSDIFKDGKITIHQVWVGAQVN